jgi:hypothetical protein
MPRMTEKLKTLLRMAVKQAGTFNPDECLFYVEEHLDDEEFSLASRFLRWLHLHGKTFGSGNFEDVFRAFARATGEPLD